MNQPNQVQHISGEDMLQLISTRTPLIKAWCHSETGGVVACDNSKGEAWTEEFIYKNQAISWLEN